MRLIDADALMRCIPNEDITSRFAVDNAPTIDAVPVVRCKNCRYMTEHYDTDGNVPYWTCSEWDSGTDYDGYCHYGEKMDEVEK